MLSALKELEIRADLILSKARSGEPDALTRLAKLPGLKKWTTKELPEQVKRKHALNLIANEFGFSSWSVARNILTGKPEDDFGTLLYPRACFGYLNNWYSNYEEALACREGVKDYLLAYKRQFLVVSEDYISTLGLDPQDPDWEKIGRDWARPSDIEARTRLYTQLITSREPESQPTPS